MAIQEPIFLQPIDAPSVDDRQYIPPEKPFVNPLTGIDVWELSRTVQQAVMERNNSTEAINAIYATAFAGYMLPFSEKGKRADHAYSILLAVWNARHLNPNFPLDRIHVSFFHSPLKKDDGSPETLKSSDISGFSHNMLQIHISSDSWDTSATSIVAPFENLCRAIKANKRDIDTKPANEILVDLLKYSPIRTFPYRTMNEYLTRAEYELYSLVVFPSPIKRQRHQIGFRSIELMHVWIQEVLLNGINFKKLLNIQAQYHNNLVGKQLQAVTFTFTHQGLDVHTIDIKTLLTQCSMEELTQLIGDIESLQGEERGDHIHRPTE